MIEDDEKIKATISFPNSFSPFSMHFSKIRMKKELEEERQRIKRNK